MTNPAPIRALGEIAIRCADHAAMKVFYRDIVGLPLLEDFEASGITFFRVASGYGGHTTVLALFAADAAQRDHFDQGAVPPAGGASSTLHHLALTVDHDRQDALCDWLTEQGIDYRVEHFNWVGWRGVFIRDPDGNTVEFVAGVPSSA